MGVDASFPGVFQWRRFHLSIAHGNIVVCDAEILPQYSLPAINGTLAITDGFTTLVIPGCRLDTAHLHMSTTEHIVRIRILGPTWHWKLAGIDGVYNVRRPDGSVEPTMQRTVQQLAAMLFDAMAVTAYDVSGLPDIDGPEVNWQGANAYSELLLLCHAFGCDFGMDVWGPTARIWRIGFGFGLPSGGRDMSQDYGIDIAEPPDRIRLYCGPTLYQSKLKLEAVMEDTDGSLVPKDDVSYKPAAGWDGTDPADPLGPDADEDERRLAKKTYLKYFLVTAQSDGSFDVPGYGSTSAVEDWLPLYPYLAADYQNDEGNYYQQEAYCEGVFAIDPVSLQNSPAGERLETQFRIDREKGLVIFRNPIHKFDNAQKAVAPELYLIASYHVRDPNTFHYVYYSQDRTIAANGTGTFPVARPDLVRRVIASYSSGGTTPTGTTDNESTLTPEINTQLDYVEAEFQTTESLVKWYIGLMPIALSGTVRQTTFFGQCDGAHRGCFTIAALNTEWEPGVPWRRQRRIQAESDRRRVMRERDEVGIRKVQRKGVV